MSACCGRARALVAGVREFCCGRRAKQRSGRRRPAPAQTATVDTAKRLSNDCLAGACYTGITPLESGENQELAQLPLPVCFVVVDAVWSC